MEQRRTRRFQLTLPLSIVRNGSDRTPLHGVTKNISSTGVLFLADREPNLGGPIEYIITLSREGPPVHIRCMGVVLRSELAPTKHSYLVAATLERYEFVRELELQMPASASTLVS